MSETRSDHFPEAPAGYALQLRWDHPGYVNENLLHIAEGRGRVVAIWADDVSTIPGRLIIAYFWPLVEAAPTWYEGRRKGKR